MTRGLEDALDLPHLDDMLKEQGVLKKASDDDLTNHPKNLADTLDGAQKGLEMIEGRDHGEAMDTIYDETLQHARDMMDLGYNTDPTRSARTFEVAGHYYKMAMEAKNSKRDAQLKSMQLALNQKKLELEKTAGQSPGIIDTQAIVHEDRNELLKRLREQSKAPKDE